MKKRSEKINNQDLKKLGFYDGELLKSAGKTVKKLQKSVSNQKEVILGAIREVLEQPEKFLVDPDFKILAEKVMERQALNQKLAAAQKVRELKKEIPTYPIYGKENIEGGALKQMDIALQLPIALAGSLMPDAHQGYGLPIGGVLATEADKVIPYAVGVDIACRMCLSIFELDAHYLQKHESKLKSLLLKNTCFGTGKGFARPDPDPLFDKDEWGAFKLLRDLKSKAIAQIGSSGTGNHFVEWGLIEIPDFDPVLGMEPGQYLSLLSHSGSRGFGAGVAGFYSKLAMEKVKLPEAAKHLAWLEMDSEEGQEYWLAMNLAGAYASANHHHIHRKIARDLELKPLKIIENHHNFAWKDQLEDGREVIIHRKGATPAHKDELGIIPGSMTAPGFLIKGKGNATSLFSASHGAGRVLSRSKARKTIQESQIKEALKENKVSLMGGDLDEAPMAYKDIHQVMAFQDELVEVLAKFYPRIVRMADKEKFQLKGKRKGLDFQET